MGILKHGSEGADVSTLQQLLTDRGFPTGAVNGHFGDGTDAALRAFQRSEGLVVDGEAGSFTMAALRGERRPARDDSALFSVNVVCRMFPATPRKNVEANLGAIITAMRDVGLADRKNLLMALATIRAETESFMPVKEGLSKYNTSPGGKPYDLYDCRRDLGNRGYPDGSRYPGRGYIQLTGLDNYARIGKAIGVDLVANPDLASDSAIAAKILAQFILNHEVAIKNALVDGDLARARRLVNGGSLGLDRFSDAYTRGDIATGVTQ